MRLSLPLRGRQDTPCQTRVISFAPRELSRSLLPPRARGQVDEQTERVICSDYCHPAGPEARRSYHEGSARHFTENCHPDPPPRPQSNARHSEAHSYHPHNAKCSANEKRWDALLCWRTSSTNGSTSTNLGSRLELNDSSI
jgi:hypothetical protein